MSNFDFNMDGLLDELERLAREVPEAVPDAINAMSDVLVPAIQKAAPVDDGNKNGEHLRDVIGKSGIKTSKSGNKYQLVHIKNRGQNDKNVYKAVVAEYGRSGKRPLAPKPFWRTAVQNKREEMLEAGKKVIEDVINNKK